MDRILIVDSDEANLDQLSHRLRVAGYTVTTTATGPKALDLIDGGQIDLVLIDQFVGGMNGLDLLREVRRKFNVRQLPVIMVATLAESSFVTEALDMGANDFITKSRDFPVILARIRARLKLSRSDLERSQQEERYALAMRGTGKSVWDRDVAASTIFCSPEWYSAMGRAPDKSSPHSDAWFALVHPNDREALLEVLRASNDQYHPHSPSHSELFQTEFRFLHADGNYRWASLEGVTLRNADGEIVRQVGSLADITQQKTIDESTGLPNRLVLSDRVEAAIHARMQDSLPPFAVLTFDVDRFRLIKDSLGAETGELFLRQVIERAQLVLPGDPSGRTCRSQLFRLSKDLFAVLIDPLYRQAEAEASAERLLRSMRTAFTLEEREISCSISIGLAVYHPDHHDAESILRDADTALNAAKTLGARRWMAFEPAMRQLHEFRLQLDSDLRLAVQREEFEVYFQSRVHLDTGKICGFEALVRWNHPVRGLVPPAEFIPLAEENGLIHEIGIWVLRRACEQMQKWRKELPLPPDFEISVNLSPAQFREPHLVRQIVEILQQTGLPAANLNLELTESMLLENFKQAKTVLDGLKKLGVGLKMDDFGTGYSSLKYLRDLPFDCLKIDRAFTAELGKNNGDSDEMIRTILQMARNLQMEVIAEGIETLDHAQRLLQMGCRFGQGYFFSRPIPAAQAEAMLKSNLGCANGDIVGSA